MKKIDPKVKNLTLGILTRVIVGLPILYCFVTYLGESDPLRLLGMLGVGALAWRLWLCVYRRLLVPPKQPLEYGKWAIVTGSTSGIGKAFATHLASLGMNVCAISRSEEKLTQQCTELEASYGVACRHIAYDFTETAAETKAAFYKQLNDACVGMTADGGVGLLVNNVGIANDIPKRIDEFEDSDIQAMIDCNIGSTVYMTTTAMKYMKQRNKGAVLSISSGSGNGPGPFIAVYSATKAFMTQFTRSLAVECWGSGIDCMVVTPFYVVSNLFKRKSGTLVAPMPDVLVRGTLAQLGKKYVWQGHGYWFHGFIGNLFTYWWGGVATNRKMMVENRQRYDAKQNQASNPDGQTQGR